MIIIKRIVRPLNSQQPVRVSQIVPTPYYGQGAGLPGASPTSSFYPEMQNPYLPAVAQPVSSNPFSNFNLKDIKGFVDRMGGIEGIMSTLTKVQKTMQTFQQMAPMLKLLIPKLGGGTTASTSLDDGDVYDRRRRRRGGGRRRRGGGGYNSGYPRSQGNRGRRSSSKGPLKSASTHFSSNSKRRSGYVKKNSR